MSIGSLQIISGTDQFQIVQDADQDQLFMLLQHQHITDLSIYYQNQVWYVIIVLIIILIDLQHQLILPTKQVNLEIGFKDIQKWLIQLNALEHRSLKLLILISNHQLILVLLWIPVSWLLLKAMEQDFGLILWIMVFRKVMFVQIYNVLAKDLMDYGKFQCNISIQEVME